MNLKNSIRNTKVATYEMELEKKFGKMIKEQMEDASEDEQIAVFYAGIDCVKSLAESMSNAEGTGKLSEAIELSEIVMQTLISDNKKSGSDTVSEPVSADSTDDVIPAEVIASMVSELNSSIEETVKDMEPKQVEAIKRISSQIIQYLVDCKLNGVEPKMAMTTFDNIGEDTIAKMVIDPNFNIIEYLNNPDMYLDRENEENAAETEVADQQIGEVIETVEGQAEEIAEDLRAALNPVNPIIKELSNGQVEVDLSKVAQAVSAPAAPSAQEPLRPTEGPKVKGNKKEKKKSNPSNDNTKKEEKTEEVCNDPACTCHENDGIMWPMNISAYFDISSLFMIKNKEMKKLVGERIARAFDNLDTLQELCQYAGDAPEIPFGFKLTSVKSKDEFVLMAERTINGRYTTITFTFFNSGATITAA